MTSLSDFLKLSAFLKLICPLHQYMIPVLYPHFALSPLGLIPNRCSIPTRCSIPNICLIPTCSIPTLDKQYGCGDETEHMLYPHIANKLLIGYRC